MSLGPIGALARVVVGGARGAKHFFVRWFLPLPAVEKLDEHERWDWGDDEDGNKATPETSTAEPATEEPSPAEPAPPAPAPEVRAPEGAEDRTPRQPNMPNPFA